MSEALLLGQGVAVASSTRGASDSGCRTLGRRGRDAAVDPRARRQCGRRQPGRGPGEEHELLEDLQETLEAGPVAGRGVLRGLLVSPLSISPSRRIRSLPSSTSANVPLIEYSPTALQARRVYGKENDGVVPPEGTARNHTRVLRGLLPAA